MLRNDSAAAARAPCAPEDKPPRLAADEEPIPSEVFRAPSNRKIEELAIRLDAYERTKRAEQALLDLEDRIEAELPPDDPTTTTTT